MARAVSAITTNSARLTRHSWRMPGTSIRFQQISRMLAAIAGSGICAIRPAPTRANSATQSAEDTPARGEPAPACRFSAERVKEPLER